MKLSKVNSTPDGYIVMVDDEVFFKDARCVFTREEAFALKRRGRLCGFRAGKKVVVGEFRMVSAS